MRHSGTCGADDAFWAARIVAQFSDEALAADSEEGGIPRAARRGLHPVGVDQAAGQSGQDLDQRRNPVVNFRLASDGTLTFENAAVNAKASTPGTGYTVSWSRFDNAADTHQPVGAEVTLQSPTPRPRRVSKAANTWRSRSKASTPIRRPGRSPSAPTSGARAAVGRRSGSNGRFSSPARRKRHAAAEVAGPPAWGNARYALC